MKKKRKVNLMVCVFIAYHINWWDPTHMRAVRQNQTPTDFGLFLVDIPKTIALLRLGNRIQLQYFLDNPATW